MTTGYATPSWATAWRTLPRSRSKPNSGACTPTTVSPRSAYVFHHARTYGSVRSQFTHEYVQKSTRTTRPARASAGGGTELDQNSAAYTPSVESIGGGTFTVKGPSVAQGGRWG